jgi:hypothetical protein
MPTTYTLSMDVSLEWGDFHVVISSNPSLESHVFEYYAKIAHFLQYWDSYKRFKYIYFVRPHWTLPTC